ncbi:MAG: metallophosphoesterase family protein [Alkalispirochaeta sp.]
MRNPVSPAVATVVLLVVVVLLTGCGPDDPLQLQRQTTPTAVTDTAAEVAAELAAVTAAGATPFDPELRNPTGGGAARLQREGVPYPSVRFIVLSDFHHLSPRLWEPGRAFARWLSTNDGKVLSRSRELLDAAERTVAMEHEADPLDFVVITGDLTANGSVQGHEDIAAMTRRIRELGVPVFVIPGNHDVNNPWAAELKGERAERVPSVRRETFMAVHASGGYEDAVSVAPDDLSYRVNVGDTLTLFLLDTVMWRDNHEIGVPRSTGEIGGRQRRWLQDELARVRREGRASLVFMHHNLLNHGPHRGYGSRRYVIDEGPRFARLFREHGVPVVVTGHIHARNNTGSVDADGAWLYELAGGAISLYPHEYRVVTIDGETQQLTMEPRRLRGFSDPAFREWSMATYSSDFVPGAMERVRRELVASSPLEEIGEVLCAGVAGAAGGGDAAAGGDTAGGGGAAATRGSEPGAARLTTGACAGDTERDLEAMAIYLALWRLQHRDGVDRPGVAEAAVAAAEVVGSGRDLWRGPAGAYYSRLQRGFGTDPPPHDGAITIDLTSGRWWSAE